MLIPATAVELQLLALSCWLHFPIPGLQQRKSLKCNDSQIICKSVKYVSGILPVVHKH